MMALVWALNIAVILFGAGAAYVIHVSGTGFALGIITATALYNCVHRLKYGYWL